MHTSFSRDYHDPIKLIKMYWPDADIGHIEYDPDMKPSEAEYYKIKQSTHDGTMLFTHELLQELLVSLVNMSTHYTPTEPKDFSKVEKIKYKIGKIRHSIVFGMVNINGRKMPGQKERVRLYVKCEYVFKEE